MDPKALETVLHYFLGGTLGAAGMICVTWLTVAALKRRALRREHNELVGRFERMEATIDWLASRMADAALREETRLPLLSDTIRTPSPHRTPH